MTVDRLRRGTTEQWTTHPPRWAQAFGATGEPPLPRPRPARVDPIRRSWPGAFWHARIGVLAGITLDDFLRSRLARYLAVLPVPCARLPASVEIEDGQLVVRPVAAPPAAPPPPEEEAWLAALVAVDGPPVRRAAAELESRIAALDGELDAARRRADERARQLAADVAVGLVAGPEVDATAEQLGRPPTRSGKARSAALALAGAALAAETWQVALPLLAAAGVPPAELPGAAARAPAEVAFAAVFALAVATGLFALVRAAIDAAVALFGVDPSDRQRRWLGSASLAAGCGAALVAAAVAALREGTAGPRLPAPALVLLLLAAPIAAVLVLRATRPDAEARAAERTAALAWDRERARSLAERLRRLEALEWADGEVGALDARGEVARRALRALHARAVEAARRAAQAERREREDLSRLAQSLVAALELDRYEFVRQASARGAHALLAPRRRKAPEAPAPPEAPRVEGAPAPRLEPSPGHLAS